jgi:hypothetical protein
MNASCHKQRGQSAVEFVLIAPLLFIIFFGIIQLAYMAFVSFAVQRAAIAVAREASLTGNPSRMNCYPKLIFSLAPLCKLNRTTFACIAASRCQIIESKDKKWVTARLHYPMPIWVPLVGRIFGEEIIPSRQIIPEGVANDLEKITSLFGFSMPRLSFDGAHLPYFRWMIFEASVFNEGFPSEGLDL